MWWMIWQNYNFYILLIAGIYFSIILNKLFSFIKGGGVQARKFWKKVFEITVDQGVRSQSGPTFAKIFGGLIQKLGSSICVISF